MKNFLELYRRLDNTNSSNEKIEHLSKYFKENSNLDNAWTIFFLSSKKIKKTVSSAVLKEIFFKRYPIQEWLFGECYEKVGSLSETISLLINNTNVEGFGDITLSDFCENILNKISNSSLIIKKDLILNQWIKLNKREILVFNKFLSGNFRLGVSERIVVKALAKYSDLEENRIMERLLGSWSPSEHFFVNLLNKDSFKVEGPYPFFLASGLDRNFEKLGNVNDWITEWKWDGIRAQLVKRDIISLWSRTLLSITDQFPDIIDKMKDVKEQFVIDGELVTFKDGKLGSFSELKKRLGRNKPSLKFTNETPATIICYDILEYNGIDLRSKLLHERRAILKELILKLDLIFSDEIKVGDWEELEEIKKNNPEYTEGLMIKNRDSAYLSGRVKGHWWKYKKDPYTVDAVMLYAEQGSGRRGGLLTNYTFGVWKEDQLVPFTKAYSGLNENEIKELDSWIKSNTISKYGPIRSVKKEQVFEIAFENIDYSARHKSGLAVRFPRILRWRKDKPASEAGNVEELMSFLKIHKY